MDNDGYETTKRYELLNYLKVSGELAVFQNEESIIQSTTGKRSRSALDWLHTLHLRLRYDKD